MMSYSNSQEQTIYRSLAGQIQLGFFDDGERFPSVQEIAHHYQVSACPAQRALKALEKDGLIELCRGKETVVLAKPYDDYLGSDVFHNRAAALADLCQSLELLSPSIGFHGLQHMPPLPLGTQLSETGGWFYHGKYLYRLFDQLLRAFGSQTVLSLYYDIGAFVESAFLDILSRLYEKEAAAQFLSAFTAKFLRTVQNHRHGCPKTAMENLEALNQQLFGQLQRYLSAAAVRPVTDPEIFHWEPYKGRTRYCDVIAIDLVCKIGQGMYPRGSFLPNGSYLADVYHVSAITIRRTITLLNKLGVTQTINGVGTKVVSQGDASLLYKRKDLMLDENLTSFLEALQLLAVTCQPVMAYTFPYFSQETRQAMMQAADRGSASYSLVNLISACMQAAVRCCPLGAIRTVYEEITHLLLKGSVLRVKDGVVQAPYWPEISAALLNSLQTDDPARFALSFRRLMERNFSDVKENLIKIGVRGAEAVAAPAFPND